MNAIKRTARSSKRIQKWMREFNKALQILTGYSLRLRAQGTHANALPGARRSYSVIVIIRTDVGE